MTLEEPRERAVDETHTLLELRLLMLLGRRECALEVVEDRDQRLHEPLVGPRDQALLVARGPLAVVLEVGRDALGRGEVLLRPGLSLREPLLE